MIDRRRSERNPDVLLTNEERERLRNDTHGLIDADLVDEVKAHLARVPEWESRLQSQEKSLSAIEHLIEKSLAEFHGAKRAAVYMASMMGGCLLLIGSILVWILNDKMADYKSTKDAVAVMQSSIAQIDALAREIKYIREEQIRNTSHVDKLLLERRP